MARRRKKKKQSVVVLVLLLLLSGAGYTVSSHYEELIGYAEEWTEKDTKKTNTSYSLEEIPPYQGETYVVLDENIPRFTEEEEQFTGEEYHELDDLGRCGPAMALVGIETMPTEERGSIGMIKPSGWHTVKYEIVSGKYLYNRCHLIGYQLTGENANEKNLITCTRSMNTTGMLEWENQVADYVKETENHVLYRVTPIFEGDNLLATGVEIEAKSIEDDGKGVQFHVFVYNVQEGIEIDYQTGDSHLVQ